MRFLETKLGLAGGDLLKLPLLLLPLAMLGLTGMWWGQTPLRTVLHHVEWALAAAALIQFVVCLPILMRAGRKLLNLEFDGDHLLVIGAGAAFALAVWRYAHLSAAGGFIQLLNVWRDAFLGAALLSMAALGDLLMRAASRSDLLPLRQGASGRCIVGPGELIPGDGVVTDGISEIQDPLGSNDIYPVIVHQGSRVHLGARNGDGALTLELDRHANSDSPQPRAGRAKGRLNASLGWGAAGTLLIAAVVAGWSIWHQGENVDPVIVVLRVLSLAAPLGLGLVFTAPTSEILSAARRMGIEIRNVDVFDLVRNVRGVLFGHRGVLVSERLRLITAHPVEGVTPVDLIRRAASVAQIGQDPWGHAILEFAVAHRMRLKPAVTYHCEIGKGMSAVTENQQILVGSRDYLESKGIDCAPLDKLAQQELRQGRRLRWVAETVPERRAVGILSFGASSVAGAVEAVKNLNQVGLATIWVADEEDPAHKSLAKYLKIGRILPATDQGADRQQANVGPLLIVAADEMPRNLEAGDVIFPLGRRFLEQHKEAMAGTARHDPRLIVDLFLLADRQRRMVLLNALIAYGSALLLVAAPFWLGARNDLASFEVGIVLLLALTPLGLRALSLTANEVDEE